MEEIVEVSLLNEKVAVYCQDPKADKMCILNKISFCEARQKYYREMFKSEIFVGDFGRRLDKFKLQNSGIINYVCLTYENSA